MGSPGKLFYTESPDSLSLECQSQLEAPFSQQSLLDSQSEVLLAPKAHKAPHRLSSPCTALVGLGSEAPWYPQCPSTGLEALCRQGPGTPTFGRCTPSLACLLTQHSGTFSCWLGRCHFSPGMLHNEAPGFWNLHLFSTVCWLLLLSSRAAELLEASLVPSEGLSQTSPETF